MGSEGVEDQRRHIIVTSQNGCLKAWSESQEKHGIALDGEDWYDVQHLLMGQRKKRTYSIHGNTTKVE